jgi:hypothetical protein
MQNHAMENYIYVKFQAQEKILIHFHIALTSAHDAFMFTSLN